MINNSIETAVSLILNITSTKTNGIAIDVVCANETGTGTKILKTFQGQDAVRLLNELTTK